MSNHKPIIRKVDGVGRVSIPSKLLEHLNLTIGSSVLLYIEDNEKMVLKKDLAVCVFCENDDIVEDLSGIEICATCRQKQEKLSAIVDKRYEKQAIPNGRRVVIPFKIRNQLNIKIGDKIDIQQHEEFLELRKVIEEK